MPHWEHFPHDADIGLRGFGRDPAEAFAQVALALTAAVTDPAAVVPRESVVLTREAADLELLLVEWLDALIFEMAVSRRIFSRFELSIEDTRLTARLSGEPVDVARHQPAVEPKGATFTALRVVQLPDGGWLAQCVVDV